jgi:uncharacterized protein (TIGR02594 family)
MLKKIVRATAVALSLLCGQEMAGWTPAFAHTRHVAGSAYGARMHGLHADRYGFFLHRRHGARPAVRHGRRFAYRFSHHPRRHSHFAGRAHFRAYSVQPRFAASPPGRPLELHPLLMVASRYLGAGRVSRQRGPWCRDFINTVARRAGYHLANSSRRAIDALRLGHRVASPRPGDLVVMRHHVTIFAGFGGRGLIGLGGNQGHGGVTYSSFSRNRVVGYVRM